MGYNVSLFLFFSVHQVSNIAMLRDHRAQLRDIKATANKSGRENVDPGSATGADKKNPECPLRILRVVWFFSFVLLLVLDL